MTNSIRHAHLNLLTDKITPKFCHHHKKAQVFDRFPFHDTATFARSLRCKAINSNCSSSFPPSPTTINPAYGGKGYFFGSAYRLHLIAATKNSFRKNPRYWNDVVSIRLYYVHCVFRTTDPFSHSSIQQIKAQQWLIYTNITLSEK